MRRAGGGNTGNSLPNSHTCSDCRGERSRGCKGGRRSNRNDVSWGGMGGDENINGSGGAWSGSWNEGSDDGARGGAAAAPGVVMGAEVDMARRPAGRGRGTNNLPVWMAGSSGPTATRNGPTVGAAAVMAETPAATSHGTFTLARAAASRDADNRPAWMASRDRPSTPGGSYRRRSGGG